MNEKRGKINPFSILVISTILLVLFSFIVLSFRVETTFPSNSTNASAYFGYNYGDTNSSFNGTNPQFHCFVEANATTTSYTSNITNVSLYISTASLPTASATKNQTINLTLVNGESATASFNVDSFNEGIYYWFCEAEDNATTPNYNTTTNRTIIIDYTPPGYEELLNASSSVISTGDTISISANFSDRYTTVHTVRLFVNISGIADNEVNRTGSISGVYASNGTRVNLSYVLPAIALGHTLNFTLQANDSVNNINITEALIFEVTDDSSAPGPINLNLNEGYNTSNSTVKFNFTAYDNNVSANALNCTINITLSGTEAYKIENIIATSNVSQVNSTSISNGTYNWNVTCLDGAGNQNASITKSFTVDQIKPVFVAGTYSNNSDVVSTGDTVALGVNVSDNLTSIEYVRLFVNISGASDNQVNATTTITNDLANLSYVIPNDQLNQILNFTFWANDSAGNSLISSPIIISVTNDGSAPAIVLNAPGDLYNVTATPEFNFTATDNIDSSFICNISIDDVVNISNINTTNGTAQINSSPNILSEGTHNWSVTCIDNLGNTETAYSLNFTVDSTGPTISIIPSKYSNISSITSITITNTDRYSTVETTNYSTSCSGTTIQGTYTSGTGFNPFNSSICTGTSSVILTINATDAVGNSNVSSFTFRLDNTNPTVNLTSPSDGSAVENLVLLNWTSTDNLVKTSYIGYYLDDAKTPVQLNFSSDGLGLGLPALEFAANMTINLTAGNHSLIITANDTLGNWGNSSLITFIVKAPIPLTDWIHGLNATFDNGLSSAPVFRVKDSNGDYNVQAGSQMSNQTFEVILEINTTGGTGINVTLTDLDGSSADWSKINMTYLRTNNTKAYPGIKNNWTNTIFHMVYANASLNEFAKNQNKYYGTVTLPINNSLVQEFWWFDNETNLKSKINIEQCDSAFSVTSKSPCWNYTSGGRTIIYVPHYSVVVAVNDTTPPTIEINSPSSQQVIGTFMPNITVSLDAANCKYTLNVTNLANTNVTSNLSVAINPANTSCIWAPISFKNNEVINITFNVTDSQKNQNLASLTFTVSDNAAPDFGVVSAGSISSSSATISIAGLNESANATVWYGSSVGSLTYSANSTNLAYTHSIVLGSLSAGTLYHFNLTIRDYNGNTARNGTYNFTTSAADSDDSSSSSSSGSSGGGGGGTAAAATSAVKVVYSKSQMWGTISAGSSISLKIDNNGIALTEVSVEDFNKDLSNVELKVSSLGDNPVSEIPAEKTYQYLSIDKTNIADSDFGKIKIKFRVLKSWLSENNLNENDIRLWRYSSGWEILSTKKTGSDATYAYYESSSTGFSYFAIGSKTAPGETAATKEDKKEEPSEAQETTTDNKVEEVVKEIFETIKKGKPALWWILLIFLISATGAGLYYVFTKKPQIIRRLERHKVHEPHDRYHELELYIKKELERGFTKEGIEATLVNVGWSPVLIKKTINNVSLLSRFPKLDNYIKKEIKKGFTREQIEKSLLDVGWDRSIFEEKLEKAFSKEK